MFTRPGNEFIHPTSSNVKVRNRKKKHGKCAVSPTVMTIKIRYNWLFYWDEIHSINGILLVVITGKWP